SPPMKIYEDLRVVQSRVAVLQTLAVGLVALLVIQFWNLQVIRARHFREQAESNRYRLVTLAAPRGALLDREGRVLVGNRPSFNVVLVPEHAVDLDRVVARLARTLGMGEAAIRERLALRQPYRPVVVKTDAPLDDVAALEARRLELPEVSVEVVPLRSYPLASAAAHALGRVGEITERQLQLAENKGLTPGSLVGQAGIESKYNRQLMGRDGYRRVIVNSRGAEVTEAERLTPLHGPSLTLSIDASLQETMEKAFEGRAGSAVALDPRTGEVLAMTSTPAYDPNEFTTGIDPAAWASLARDPRTPLMNKVIQGTYSPGSTFKLVVATAALQEGVITPSTTFFCPGYLAVYNTVFHCHVPRGHGFMDLRRGIANSCNVYFFQVGIRLEIARLAKWAKLMGLGAPTGIDLPHEGAGLMPSPEWKMRVFKTPWYAGETVSVAIGQGQVSATPLQMARLVAVIANGGRLVQPHLARRASAAPPVALEIRPETIAAVKEGMRAVVAEGTGWRSRLATVEVCGKTGSAQVVARSRLEKSPNAFEMLPHGWFLAFAPADDPRIALAVLVEHGRSGAESAAPVARQILAEFFGVDRPAPPPAGALDTDAED
ncbi:MAG TPA: penicillin-binding protein 2, partial [Vicinamibacteria bacterium]|nr:penicillin-binding protein 2 [Vicinamibacteria bacterium]